MGSFTNVELFCVNYGWCSVYFFIRLWFTKIIVVKNYCIRKK